MSLIRHIDGMLRRRRDRLCHQPRRLVCKTDEEQGLDRAYPGRHDTLKIRQAGFGC